ncbi:MAG: hypothetical protein NDI69_18005 [Bacteriovoracaceae bacterium]|nr:hypothetical protein [Bacteriovoracaceae bacterium]
MKKNNKYLFGIIAVFNIAFVFPGSAIADLVGPKDERSVEQRQLDRLYLDPMSGINSSLNTMLRLCNRFPTEQEFKDFILNGTHKNIKCSDVIKTKIEQREEMKIGKNFRNMTAFFERNEHKVYSDTKKIFVILKVDSKNWRGKYFESKDYAFVINCTFGAGNCFLTPFELRAKSCRASEAFAQKQCYFNGKKIIDY